MNPNAICLHDLSDTREYTPAPRRTDLPANLTDLVDTRPPVHAAEERKSSFEILDEQHSRLTTVDATIMRTTRELCARQALKMDTTKQFETLEVLFAVQQRERSALAALQESLG